MSTGLRPATADDREFLHSVYAATRTDELSVVPWTDAQKQAFLRMQFDAQDSYLRQIYPEGRFLVVTLDGEPIGRLYVVRLADELRLVDIALLPQHRGAGIGTALISNVVAEAAQAGLPLRLHVELGNRARRLYERLGFRSVETGPVYELMELAAPGDSPPGTRL